MNEFYTENKDFKDYVDKYVKENKISVDEAFTHAIVKEIYNYYKSKA